LAIGGLADHCFLYTYNSNNQLSLLMLCFIVIAGYYPLIRLLRFFLSLLQSNTNYEFH